METKEKRRREEGAKSKSKEDKVSITLNVSDPSFPDTHSLRRHGICPVLVFSRHARRAGQLPHRSTRILPSVFSRCSAMCGGHRSLVHVSQLSIISLARQHFSQPLPSDVFAMCRAALTSGGARAGGRGGGRGGAYF
eukprot:3443698-Rhodomonas_salina.1